MGVLTPSPLSLDTLAGLTHRRTAPRPPVPARLPVPAGMTTPLGCDAVAVPVGYGPLIRRRLPRMGCVYGDESYWWLLVPSDSDVALEWPAPARYTTGALVPDARRAPELIHRPDGSVPYTPPIPLYLALCTLTGTTPAWSSSLPA